MSEMSDIAGGMLSVWKMNIAYSHSNTMDSARQFARARLPDDASLTVVDSIAWELYSATNPFASGPIP